jgi:hypothetical protein
VKHLSFFTLEYGTEAAEYSSLNWANFSPVINHNLESLSIRERLAIFDSGMTECRDPEIFLPILEAAGRGPNCYGTEDLMVGTPPLLHLLAECLGRATCRNP